MSSSRAVRRGWAAIVSDATMASAPVPPDDAHLATLPPRYHDGRPVSSAPMGGAADLVHDDDGRVAWDRIWADFCDLALAGGPPHRETMLDVPSPESVAADPEGSAVAMAETIRALTLVTHWEAVPSPFPGWAELVCPDDDAAIWLERAILAENVRAVRDGSRLRLPVGPDFAVEKQIRNVVTATAKAHHYWTEHRAWLDAFLRSQEGRGERSEE
ncbi:MAG: hypothetical protein QM753_16575 [Thermomicrobiales bacterium]